MVTACVSHYQIKMGTYKSVPFGKFEMKYKYFFSGVIGFHCGSKLIISSDSSFIYERYPFISSGTWHCNQDSLTLVFNEYKWMNDSLKIKFSHDKMPVFHDEPRNYQVRENYLIRYIPTNNNKKIVEKLEFNTP